MRRIRALLLVMLSAMAMMAGVAVVPAPARAAEAATKPKPKPKPKPKAKPKEVVKPKAPPPPLLVIEGVEVEPSVARAMERVDVAIRLSGGPFENPHDPKEIDVRAVFEARGEEPVTVPAFWHQDFRADEAAKRLVPEGEPGFRVRFTPRKAVVYTCTVRATAGKRKAESEPVRLQVLGAREDAPAFLRFHPENPAYYQDPRTGKTTWQWLRETIDTLADAGATCVRLPMHSWHLPLESQGKASWIRGLEVGRYDLGNAWLVDEVIARCAARGLVVLPVVWNAAGVTLEEEPPYAILGKNQALAYRRLRYQVARWSYSPAVLGWTLFDNAGFNPMGSSYWRKMVAYVRGLDPNPHFVFNTPYGVDHHEYVYLHPYGYPLAGFRQAKDKPYLVSLHGTPEHPERLARAGLWAVLASGRAGALYAHAWHLREAGAVDEVYRTAAAILKGTDLGACAWKAAYFEPIAGPGGLHFYGMVGGGRRAIIFVMRTSAHNAEPYPPADGNVIRAGDFDKGAYTLLWYGPGEAEPMDRSDVNCRDGTIVVSVPDGIRWQRLVHVVPAEEAKGR